MSEARNQRFEIDIDEIERQLRRSVEQPAEPKADPLAELARIVGQNDPFQGILTGAQRHRAEPANANTHPGYVEPRMGEAAHPASHADAPYAPATTNAATSAAAEPPYSADPHALPPGYAFDPVSDAYGSQDEALAQEQFQPLRRRPSRGRLIAVMAALVVAVSAVALGLSYRKSGGLLASGAPPVIVADKSPLKVAPENPGGVQVANQDRQIYAKATPDGQSRVVDGREQPVDVRAATPAIPPRPPASAERNPALAEALGEPRRVRTVAVNPDGTNYGAAPGAVATPMATGSQNLLPAGELPTPVTVQTVAVPTRSAPPTPAPVAERPQAEATSTHQAVSVLPPARPNLEGRGGADTPTRTAALPPPAAKPAPAPKPAAEAPKPATAARTEKPAADKPAAEKPAAGARNFAVQIAVRPTEQEARTAWDQAQEKFGSSLGSTPARLTNAQVNGKTVHRVRLGPMTKPEADAMCTRLKASGGNCFVAVN